MKRVLFHIGLHKTGTTWLQKVLFPTLADVSVQRSRDFHSITRIVAEHRDRPLIISHEGLSGSISPFKEPGDRHSRLVQNIDSISRIRDSRIIIGFRQQLAWLNSAYAERAKKENFVQQEYIKTFAPTELSWLNILNIVDGAGVPVFVLLYEELVSRPETLISDLCRFIGTAEPRVQSGIAQKRENHSPRSSAGQAVSRFFVRGSRLLKRIPYASNAQRPLRAFGSRIGTALDGHFPPAPAIALDEQLEALVQSDWSGLVRLVGKRRGRDFSDFLHSAPLESQF